MSKIISIALRGEVSTIVTATVPVTVPDDFTDAELTPQHLELLAAAGDWVDENDNTLQCGTESVNDIELDDNPGPAPLFDADDAKASLTRTSGGKLACQVAWDDLALDEYYQQQLMTLSNTHRAAAAPRTPHLTAKTPNRPPDNHGSDVEARRA